MIYIQSARKYYQVHQVTARFLKEYIQVLEEEYHWGIPIADLKDTPENQKAKRLFEQMTLQEQSEILGQPVILSLQKTITIRGKKEPSREKLKRDAISKVFAGIQARSGQSMHSRKTIQQMSISSLDFDPIFTAFKSFRNESNSTITEEYQEMKCRKRNASQNKCNTKRRKDPVSELIESPVVYSPTFEKDIEIATLIQSISDEDIFKMFIDSCFAQPSSLDHKIAGNYLSVVAHNNETLEPSNGLIK